MSLPISAIVLAAGASSRMGKPKALLEWKGSTFLEVICSKLSELDIPQTIVVISPPLSKTRRGEKAPGGCFCSRLAGQSIPLGGIDWVENPRPEDGMLSSFRCGLRKLDSKETNIMLCLVDHPAVELETYKTLCEKAKKNKIIVPVCERIRGHPVIFGADFISELLGMDCPEGAKTVVKAHPESVLEIEVDDKGILMDIDTPEEYEAAKSGS